MAAEREAKALHHPGSFISSGLDGAEFLFESGSAEDALKQLDDVMSRTENETVPGETLGIARRRSLVIRATIGDGIGRQDEVARSLALLETEADKLPDSLTTQSQVAYVRGLVALSEVIASRRLVISAGASHSTYTASGVRFRPLRSRGKT